MPVVTVADLQREERQKKSSPGEMKLTMATKDRPALDASSDDEVNSSRVSISKGLGHHINSVSEKRLYTAGPSDFHCRTATETEAPLVGRHKSHEHSNGGPRVTRMKKTRNRKQKALPLTAREVLVQQPRSA